MKEFSAAAKHFIGQAASELICRGSRYQLGIRTVNGCRCWMLRTTSRRSPLNACANCWTKSDPLPGGRQYSLALVWPRHTGHSAAQAWFAKSGHRAWATNPLVQLGVLRLLTNPAVTYGAVSARNALETLAKRSAIRAQFWPLSRDVVALLGPRRGRAEGPPAVERCPAAGTRRRTERGPGDLRRGNRQLGIRQIQRQGIGLETGQRKARGHRLKSPPACDNRGSQ